MEPEWKRPYEADIRAEVIVAQWLEGLPPDELEKIAIRPAGPFRRGYSPDILSVEPEVNEYEETVICVQVSRCGLFDRLPEGLFHQYGVESGQTGAPLAKEQMVRRIRKRQEEERAARKFFRPFDQAFNRYRILLEIEERNAVTGFENSMQQELFETLWGKYDHQLSEGQKATLLNLLPVASRVAGDPALTADCFRAVLRTPVDIEARYGPLQSTHSEEEESLRLGKSHLGVDFVPGDFPEETDLRFELRFGPVPGDRLPDFLPAGRDRRTIDLLCRFFVPMEIEVAVQVETSPGEYQFDLTETAETGRLGYTTII